MKHTRQEKIVTEVGATKKVATTSKTILITLGAALVAASFMISIFLPPVAPSVQGIKSEQSAKSKEIDKYIETALASDVKYENLQKEYNSINEEYQIKRAEARVFGFPSWHKFLWAFGVALILICHSTYNILTINLHKSDRRKAARYVAMISFTVSSFYMAWVLFPYDDLPKKTYFTILIGIAILSCTAAIYISRIDFQTRSRLKRNIRTMFSFIYTETDRNGYIKSKLKNDYARKRLELTDKVVGNE